jgi:tetratricopeptide (TPR) repeat protein
MASGARTHKSLDLVDVYYNLGLVYFKQEQYEEALRTWQKALERDPGNEVLQERIDAAKAQIES